MKTLAIIALLLMAAARPARADDKGGGVYPNDAGPETIDVSKYPEEIQKTYPVFQAKCSTCHTIRRPINSQFLELSADEIEKLKKEHPEAMRDKLLLQPEEGLWRRYVKRMMSKPGCTVGRDGERIWKFLVYDSKRRKTGDNLEAWLAHRKKLLAEFKKSNPDAFARLFGSATKEDN